MHDWNHEQLDAWRDLRPTHRAIDLADRILKRLYQDSGDNLIDMAMALRIVLVEFLFCNLPPPMWEVLLDSMTAGIRADLHAIDARLQAAGLALDHPRPMSYQN
jgi:hypothetical protein